MAVDGKVEGTGHSDFAFKGNTKGLLNCIQAEVKLKDRRVGLRKQKATFTGQEAATALVEHGLAGDMNQAQRCGEYLLTEGFIQSVQSGHQIFSVDNGHLYRFGRGMFPVVLGSKGKVKSTRSLLKMRMFPVVALNTSRVKGPDLAAKQAEERQEAAAVAIQAWHRRQAARRTFSAPAAAAAAAAARSKEEEEEEKGAGALQASRA
eukprot:CAMPEP_0194673194 /NCGR_PEP_ID=MMETSP0295-20121207/6909_1 /TAXON_ID=39354 /ORGANISM="Heterosigma akashiwo, Strain CCMP2393" /LENGTH=205 /DNA_ID=CAMNT_0039557075 /DNA_START=176 /DNA_END=789 /DNA_ORIENTATION=+